jgi:hypothetical protein
MTRMAKVSSPNRIVKAGIPPEVLQPLKALKSARSSNVRIKAILDASEGLHKLQEEVGRSQTPISIASAKRICAMLRRSASPSLRNPNCRILYDDGTVQALAGVLVLLSRVSLRKPPNSESSGQPNDNSKRKRIALVINCLNTLSAVCERAEQNISWRACLEYARAGADLAETDVGDLLNNSATNNIVGVLAHKLGLALRDSLRHADIGVATSVFESVRAYKSLKPAISEALTKLLGQESPVLPSPSQEWIMATLGIERDARSLSYANPADAPEIRQAAGLLLLLWDNATESSTMREALDRFRALCEKHFRLYLKGEPGQMVKYDNRLHEGNESASGNVRLTRPWVEFIDPPRSSVVIRAIVAPA